MARPPALRQGNGIAVVAPPSPRSWGSFMDGALAGLGALLLAVYTARTRLSFINPDEANSIKYARMDVFTLIRELRYDSHLPGYPLLLKAVTLTVGIGSSSLYWVNVGLLFVLLFTVSAGSPLFLQKLAKVAFLALNPFVLEIFGEVRPYALLFTSLMMVLLDKEPSEGQLSPWLVPLGLSHHLGFAAAGLAIGVETVRRLRARRPLPWLWIGLFTAILPLVVPQTLQVAAEGRYVGTSQHPVGYGLAIRLQQMARLFVGGPAFEVPLYDREWITAAATATAVAVLIWVGHERDLRRHLTVVLVSLAGMFLVPLDVIDVHYYTGSIAVLVFLVIAPASATTAGRRVANWAVPIGLTALGASASLAILKGETAFYKVNYTQALEEASHSDYSEILLANGGVRGAAMVAFDITTHGRPHKPVHDIFADFYTGAPVTPAVVRFRITDWARANPGKRALLIYSAAPFPGLQDSPGVQVVAGPWPTKPGDYVSVVIEPG